MKLPWFLVLLALGFATPLAVQQTSGDSEGDSECTIYLKTPLPAEALTVPVTKAWPGCDSYKSYSGIGRRADFQTARKCA
jgi:hypothetical protein